MLAPSPQCCPAGETSLEVDSETELEVASTLATWSDEDSAYDSEWDPGYDSESPLWLLSCGASAYPTPETSLSPISSPSLPSPPARATDDAASVSCSWPLIDTSDVQAAAEVLLKLNQAAYPSPPTSPRSGITSIPMIVPIQGCLPDCRQWCPHALDIAGQCECLESILRTRSALRCFEPG
jgi:hypothetical protein